MLQIDGMDEVSNNHQLDITAVIEQLYIHLKEVAKKRGDKIRSKIFITARPYVKDRLKSEHSKYSIDRMRMPKIETFIQKWHSTVLSDKQDYCSATEWSESLFEKVQQSKDLRSIATTPLLCAMICSINYFKNGVIPDNKGELYEQCCHMLIEDRDRERKISVETMEKYGYLTYTAETKILQQIAFHMMNCEQTNSGKSEILEFMKKAFADKTIIEIKRIGIPLKEY